MYKNYLKVALRNMRRHFGYTLINVGGFAVGMACCILIGLYVADELSYDRFHNKYDRIYRISQQVETPDGSRIEKDIPAPIGPAARNEVPEVLNTVRFGGNGYMFEYGGDRYQENNIFFADSSVFDIFSFDLLQGDPNTALTQPYSLVLTEEVARKYFGDGDPLGQTLVADGKHVFTITGILAEIPRTSHLHFDMLMSMSTGEALFDWLFNEWNFGGVYTYALLPREHDVSAVEAKLSNLYNQHLSEQGQDGKPKQLLLEPLGEIHLSQASLRPTLYLFSVIAIFVLVIAGVNFTNLSTVRSTERVREIGVRKALGAERKQLHKQFLVETVLLSLFALILALGLSLISFPFFETISGKDFDIRLVEFAKYLPLLLLCAVVVGILAGVYPALILSRFKPIKALRGLARTSSQGSTLRKSLVGFQFVVSIVLIAATAIVYSQLDYVRDKDLGFDQKQTLVLDFGGDADVQERIETIKEELKQHHAISGITASGNVPGDYFAVVPTTIEGVNHMDEEVRMAAYSVDYDFLSLYGLKLVAGRPFSPDFQTDLTEALLLNQEAVSLLGYASPEEALGKPYVLGRRRGHIIGVVENFHFESLHHTVQPLTLQLAPGNTGYFSLRIETEDIQNTLVELAATWQALVPGRPFQYSFLDEAFDADYLAEEALGTLFGVFSGLAILIACLGLFGLMTFTATRRRKEIGVRKVLGASVMSIVVLLSSNFLKPIAAAFLIATPLTYLAMQKWLDGFAYSVDIGLGVFLLAGGLVLLIAILTVSYQSIRTALANPVKSLRYE